MCMAVPLKLVEINNEIGTIESGGIQKKVNLSLVENPKHGDYVVVHAGFAISIMNQEEAEKTLDIIRECLELEDREK
ncbi:MAG TPA: HypC/HybG/HupF family hydrogenase formation chaperone [Candidatus Aminicenantes bacterium]|nr:HypC/HybG/HupF family hydrogenase formation chaperone [Candidatus Aminicenantes bacterium]